MTSDSLLLLNAGVLLANSALFARVADHTAAGLREPSRDRRAVALFTTWWAGLGVAFAFQGFSAVLYAIGLHSVPLQVVVVLGTMAALAVALCGLAYSVAYMMTGRRLLAPIVAYHASLYAAFVALLVASRPAGVLVSTWGTRLAVERELLGMAVVLTLLFVPPLLAGGACLVLARRLAPSRARSRFFAVGLSVLLLFVTALAFELPGGVVGPWMVLGLVAMFVAALAVTLAYEPPRWLRRALAAHA